MKLIYPPMGRAYEYSPLALNVYTGGCDHGCHYCYCKRYANWGLKAKPRNLTGLPEDATEADQQVLLTFISDPYCRAELTYGRTRAALGILKANRCSVAILTKGGTRCLRDMDLFTAWPDDPPEGGPLDTRRIMVGATLTFVTPSKSEEYEPGAALPDDRMTALMELYQAGVQTWASIEPVIDPDESLKAIRRSLAFVNGYKVGKLNYRATDINLSAFGVQAVTLIRQSGRKVYVKEDLRRYMPQGFLRPEEMNMDTVVVRDRPKSEV